METRPQLKSVRRGQLLLVVIALSMMIVGGSVITLYLYDDGKYWSSLFTSDQSNQEDDPSEQKGDESAEYISYEGDENIYNAEELGELSTLTQLLGTDRDSLGFYVEGGNLYRASEDGNGVLILDDEKDIAIFSSNGDSDSPAVVYGYYVEDLKDFEGNTVGAQYEWNLYLAASSKKIVLTGLTPTGSESDKEDITVQRFISWLSPDRLLLGSNRSADVGTTFIFTISTNKLSPA